MCANPVWRTKGQDKEIPGHFRGHAQAFTGLPTRGVPELLPGRVYQAPVG